jgi:hypothetical protein
MPERRSVLIGVALAIGYAIVIAGPAFLLWNALRPEPWTERSVSVRFESVRYKAGGLVFTYIIENRSRRAARFLPEATKVRVLQPSDSPVAGYPSVALPLNLERRGWQRVEIRLDLPSPRSLPPLSPGGASAGWLGDLPVNPGEAFVSPLPRKSGDAPPEAPPQEISPPERLRDIDGFELTDQSQGLRIVFPRAW